MTYVYHDEYCHLLILVYSFKKTNQEKKSRRLIHIKVEKWIGFIRIIYIVINNA